MTIPHVDGPRACTKAERPEMIALVDAVMREGTDQSFLTDYPLVYHDSNLENIFIIKVDGKMASVVPFITKNIEIEGCRFRLGIISSTATAPKHRRKGYGLKCLRACVEKMTREGIELSVLWTMIPTFRFYEHCGYQGVRSHDWIYTCTRADASLFADYGEEVAQYDPATRENIDAVRAMHEQDICGVVRAREEYPALFSLPEMKTLLARRGGRPVAYLLVSRAINKPGLIEAGGEESALETLVHRALSELKGENEFTAYGNLTRTPLGNLLHNKMSDREQSATIGDVMMRINDARGFMSKISSWLVAGNRGKTRSFSVTIMDTRETIGFEFSKASLKLGNERHRTHEEMSLREFTSIVFGPHPERPVDVPDIFQELFPFYFPIWILDHS